MSTNSSTELNPSGICMCGCGQPVPRAKRTRGKTRKGDFLICLHGHNIHDKPLYIVNPETGCWDWQWFRDKDGYGMYKQNRAHRFFYEKHVGPIPEGHHLDHLCRNRGCVNPEHLEPVVPAVNVYRSSLPKLTREQVDLIRSLHPEVSRYELAERFGISYQQVCRILNYESWAL